MWNETERSTCVFCKKIIVNEANANKFVFYTASKYGYTDWKLTGGSSRHDEYFSDIKRHEFFCCDECRKSRKHSLIKKVGYSMISGWAGVIISMIILNLLFGDIENWGVFGWIVFAVLTILAIVIGFMMTSEDLVGSDEARKEVEKKAKPKNYVVLSESQYNQLTKTHEPPRNYY